MITLYSHTTGANGWKVANVLDELGLKYETKHLDFKSQEQKAPAFTKLNPNGRIPAIVDHDNNDFVLWESNSIIKYLADRYDKERKISFAPGTNESYHQDQWMTFQASGQGPYFGQAGWFLFYHPERVPSAIERYLKETERVISVLDGVLAKQRYLLGDKLTVADLCFTNWNDAVNFFKSSPKAEGLMEIDLNKYPHYQRWDQELKARPAVAKNKKIQTEYSAAYMKEMAAAK